MGNCMFVDNNNKKPEYDEVKRCEEEIALNKPCRFVRVPLTAPHALIERCAELEVIHNTLRDYGIINVIGAEGIGKTELANMYIDMYRKQEKYETIVWVSVRNVKKFYDSVKITAEKLGILENNENHHTTSDETPSLETLTKEIYDRLSHHKTLIVFDNVPTPTDSDPCSHLLEHYFKLFCSPLLDTHSKPHTMILSQQQVFKGKMVALELSVFTLLEAIKTIKNQIKGKLISYEETIELAEMCKCFPLGLQQAITEINKRSQVEENFLVSNFIAEVKANKEHHGEENHYQS